MHSKILLSLLLSLFLFTTNAQVTAVSYQLEYNATTCDYDFSIITTGEAVTLQQRIQYNGQVTFLTKAGSTLSITDRYQPTRVSGGLPNNWNINVIAEAPVENPLYNYYAIGPALSPTSAYEVLNAVDTIKLFSVTTSLPSTSADDIRLLDNNTDIVTIANGNYSQGFTIGGINQLYVDNADETYPSEYGIITGPSAISIGESTTVSPEVPSSWTSTDLSVCTIDGNGDVIGVGLGTSTLEYVTDNGCLSTVALTVQAPVTNDRVGIGTTAPAQSAILDISSTDKGVLLPRLTSEQRTGVPNPAEGLIVYQTNSPEGLYIYTPAGWQLLATIDDGSGNRPGLASGEALQPTINELKAEIVELRKELGALKSK